MRRCVIGYKSLPETGEHKMTWMEDGQWRESKSCYETDKDAIRGTIRSEVKRARESGCQVSLTKSAQRLLGGR